eukprot:4280698-Heterocapsa_arctica.AAC.1
MTKWNGVKDKATVSRISEGMEIVRQIIHNKAEKHWQQCMEYDIDGRGYNQYMEQTLDTKEWGGFKQIVIFSKIDCINIEIRCFGMTSNRVMGMSSSPTKSVSVSCTATTGSGGGKPNHYDLLHKNQQAFKTGIRFITKARGKVDPIQRRWEGYFESREKGTNKNKEPKRPYREEVEDGTRTTIINIS